MRGPVGIAAIIILGCIVASCGTDAKQCVQLPCALPVAIELRVTAADGGQLGDVIVQVSGASNGSAMCTPSSSGSTCMVPGPAGDYQLEVSAKGFVTVRQTVSVAGTTPECGCPTTTVRHVDIALVRSR
jgi:hypothetical protein